MSTVPEKSPGPEKKGHEEQGGILNASAVMAAGTLFSRLSGLIRSVLLAAALGTALHADLFNIANTIPNMLYILLAGGVFNAVLVPQLVRAMKSDADGGEAYTSRLITLAALFLAGVTAVLVLAAPWLMRLFLDPAFFTSPDLAAHRDSAIAFARYCLPQVFFYGMFVLAGQVLNSRRVFGPMMWAPIANNAIAIAALGAYLWFFGGANDVCANPSLAGGTNSTLGPYSSGQEALLGLGSTLGIAVQFLILVPYLRRAGFTFSPRFDFKDAGLTHTLKLGVWTVLFVIVNQIAYTVVVRLASSGAVRSLDGCSDSGGATGYTVYSTAFLIAMVPHSIATVSLATAMLPRLSAFAADGDLRGLATSVTSTMRTTYALILPFALLLPVISLDLVHIGFGYGAASSSYRDFAPSLALFGVGIVFFTSHYLLLRAFYALERNRLVFFIQCAIAAANIALAWLLTRNISAADTAPRLVIAYTCAYAVGACISFYVLSRLVGGLAANQLVGYLVRLGACAVAAAGVAWLTTTGVHTWSPWGGWTTALVSLFVSLGVAVLAFLALTRALRVREVGEIVATLTGRLGRR